MSEPADLNRIHDRIDGLHTLHQKNVTDLALHGARIDAQHERIASFENVMKQQVVILQQCCEQNKENIRSVQTTESNIKAALSILKWILGLLWGVVALALSLMYGIKAP